MPNYNKTEILEQLDQRFQRWNELIRATTDENLQKPRGAKWSIAELSHHMILTTASVASMLKYSSEMLKTRFGSPENGSRSFEEIVEHYNKILATPRKAPEKYVPKPDAKLDRDSLLNDWNSIFPKFKQRLDNWSEEDLDNHGVPHPVFKMITIREHLYMAFLHIDLHLGQLRAEGVIQ